MSKSNYESINSWGFCSLTIYQGLKTFLVVSSSSQSSGYLCAEEHSTVYVFLAGFLLRDKACV